jgi:UPF0176 protein
MSNVVAALYKFVTLDDYRELRQPLLDVCQAAGIRGSLLLAHEGINGTIAGTRAGIDRVLTWLRSDPRLADLDWKESLDDAQPFDRMKVKLKKEIVTLGVDGIDPNRRVGKYVEPKDWNAIISDPDVLLLDTRNDYEVKVGTFRGAINPDTETFREFPQFTQQFDPARHKKVAMFCTGGIRCEKASAFMLERGFDEVYHLRGGILRYLEEVPAEKSLWEGECFVFDHRVTVDHALDKGTYTRCDGCGWPVSAEEQQSPHYEAGVSCPHCFPAMTEERRARFRQRRRQLELEASGERHRRAPVVHPQE